MESVESVSMSTICKNGGQTQTQTQTRECTHCGVRGTPQWREGPLGPKTLCNACGVRFKSGRLLPEYRPACSPTFSSELHSNHHRKVIEMRKKKETSSSINADEPGLNQPVQKIESVELAFKNSVRKEKAFTGSSTHNGDGFSIGDLLNFSNDDILVEDETNVEQGKRGVSISLSDGSSSVVEDFESHLANGLSIPMDDLAGIEWLSDFVDDSLKPYSALKKKPNWLTGNRRRTVEHVKKETCLKPPVPVGRRSKRARTGASFWSLGSTTSTLSSSGPSSLLWHPGAEFLEPEVNKQSMMSAVSINGGQTQSQTQTRRCSSCGVQETPKWRWSRGVLPEAKLLCNACGLRSGQCLELPSNHKVTEMRRKKEEAVTGGVQNGNSFSFDDLLNNSNDNAFVEVEVEYEDEAELKARLKREASASRDDETTLHRSNDVSSAWEHVGSLPTSELSIPVMGLAERLSDSLKPMKKRILLTGNRRHPVAPLVNEDSCFKTTLPVEIRSKRDQTGVIQVSVGPLGLPPLSSTTTSSLSSSDPSHAPLVSGAECLEPAVQKQKEKKKKPPSVCENGGQTQSKTRQCTHCGTEETPQWRRGRLPEAKLLCNACGMRSDEGRLLPEYRPACSPSVSSGLYSNFHSEVIKTRQKKEEDVPGH